MKYLPILGLTAILVLALGVISSDAHEERHIEIDGKTVELEVGWLNEPAYANLPNKVELLALLHVEGQHEDHGTGAEEGHGHSPSSFGLRSSPHIVKPQNNHTGHQPLLGLENYLKVEVTTGGESITLPLTPLFGEPGHYVADLMPTVPGTYVFRFFGVVNGTEVNEVFDCSEGHFSCVEPLSAIQFPEKTPPPREIQNSLSSFKAKLTEIDAKISSLTQSGQRVESIADNLTSIAYGGLGAGIVGIVVAGIALARKGKQA